MHATLEPADNATQPVSLGLALEELQNNNIRVALAMFADIFRHGLDLEEDRVAGVMIEVASALISAFERDPQSQDAYDFLRQVSTEAADVVASLIGLANFPVGDEDPTKINEPIILAYVGALSAAGSHEAAIGLLTTLVVKRPTMASHHALFVANRRQAGLNDDLRGRFCEVPFQDFEVLPGGNVHLCCAAFMEESVGNLVFMDHKSIWNSEGARRVRQSIHDGSFRYCNKIRCPRFSYGLPLASEVIEAAEAMKPTDTCERMQDDREVGYGRHLAPIIRGALTEIKVPPAIVNLSFDKTCNLACPSCRRDFIAARSEERNLMLEIVDRVMPLLMTARLVNVTGSGDPFASKTFRQVLHSINPEDCPQLKVQLITNAVLFTPKEWEQIAHLHGRIAHIRISIDAARPETYAIVRKGGDWDKLSTNLRFIAGLLRQGACNTVSICFVVQALNWREMPAFVRLGRELGINVVYFSPLENWGTFDAGQFEANAVHFGTHPEHKAFRQMLATSPELDDPIAQLGSLFDGLRDQTRYATA